MHSRIYQIESFPVEPDYRITEDNYIATTGSSTASPIM